MTVKGLYFISPIFRYAQQNFKPMAAAILNHILKENMDYNYLIAKLLVCVIHSGHVMCVTHKEKLIITMDNIYCMECQEACSQIISPAWQCLRPWMSVYAHSCRHYS